MPNQQNIESPITLVSFGRSGTSLLSNIFSYHPQCRSINETVNLIFGIWHTVELATFVTDPLLVDNGVIISNEERAARAVRQTFLTCFPDDQPYWFQKPIGPPQALSAKFADGLDESRWAEAAEWYWQVMTLSFPKAKYFTILRHPCDVVLSAQAYWGSDPIDIWTQLGLMAYFLSHPASPVQYAVHYEGLVQNKESAVRDLFTYLELPFHEQILEAFSQSYGASGRSKTYGDSARRSHEWDQLDPTKVTPFQVEHQAKLFAKFGYTFELPAQFKVARLSDNHHSPEAPEQIIRRLYQEIINANTKNAALKVENMGLKDQVQKQEQQISQQQAVIEQFQAEIQNLKTALTAITYSRGWQVLQFYRTLKNKLLSGLRHFGAYFLSWQF